MDIITRARTAASKVRWERILLFGIPFVLVCGVGLLPFTDGTPLGMRWLFPFAMALFYIMIVEDWLEMTVDTRLTAILLVLLLFSSEEHIGNFLLTGLIVFLPLRAIFLASSLWRSRSEDARLRESYVEYDGSHPRVQPFLPSFGTALAIFALLEILRGYVPLPFITALREAAELMWGVLSVEQGTAGVLVLVLLWGLLESAYRRRMRRVHLAEEDAAIGMGDVIVLPIFAAFLGITTFSFVLLVACLIHVAIYVSGIVHWEV